MDHQNEPAAASLGEPAFTLTRKRRGEIAELAFMRRAMDLGFGVAKPWGDSDHYDFILTRGHFFWRLQVKSAWRGTVYLIKSTGSDNKPYTPDQIDFLAAYIGPENLWYVFPADMIGNRRGLYICLHPRRSQLGQYREAWHLIRNCPHAHLCQPAADLGPFGKGPSPDSDTHYDVDEH